MLLSIIIPVFNTKEYLEKCVGSVIDNKANDYEIILVDDGSTDGESGKFCDCVAEKFSPIVRVIHQENMGLGGARNTGIREALGEYLMFVDSDDTLAEGAVSSLITKIEETKPDIISFNFYIDYGEENLEKKSSNYIVSDKPFKLADRPQFLLSLPNACSRVWRKSLFTENNIFFPNRVWYEDLRTMPKLFAKADTIITIEDHLYLYYQRQGSIMHSANIDRNVEIIDAFEDILGWYRENGLLEQYRDVLCELCIEHVYIPASVRVLLANTKHPLLKRFSDYVRKNFPEYKKSPYIANLPVLKRLVFRLLEIKQYRLIAFLFRIRGR